MEKEQLLREKINLIAKYDDSSKEKHEILSNLLTEYYKHCYENNIKDTINIFELGPSSYIIPSTPEIYNLNTDEVSAAFQQLKDVNLKFQQGIMDGISLEEAELILKWIIQNTRTSLARNEKDFSSASLTGCCGFAQSMTLLPLIEVGSFVTINNVDKFPNAPYRHAFGTVQLPIKEEGKIYYKQYLLDASYRQFFTTAECNPGRYYLKNYNGGPAAGYYVCQTEAGRKFASELLTKGYIELTEENAKIYGNGFDCESLNISNLDRQNELLQTSGRTYINVINTIQEKELNNDKEELEAFGDIITPPGIDSRKM